MNLKKISIAVALACAAIPVYSEEQTDKEDNNVVTVTADRSEVNVAETTNTVSVITAEQMETEQARNIKDLVRYEPGVSVPSNGRWGLTGFKIRGIGGDRVLTMVDGVPVADEFSFGPNLSAGRNFIDLDNLKAVEIVRGASSSLYGSNAIGGTVSLVTKDPIDYVGTHNDGYYTSLKVGYGSVDSGSHITGTFAAGNETFQGMLLATYRNVEEFEGFYSDSVVGPERQSPNPQDGKNKNLYGKLVYTPMTGHKFKLIYNAFDAEVATNSLSAVGTRVFGIERLSVLGNDEQTRDRVSLQYFYDGNIAMADTVSFNLYNQKSETSQITDEVRSIYSRNRQSFFNQKNFGLKLQFNKAFGSDIKHQLSYGLDWDKMETDTLRLGNTTNLDGTPRPEFTAFPTRDFPNSEYKSLGVFLQDRISFADNKFILVPSIRYDKFDLEPTADEIYLSGNAGTPAPEDYSESKVSAKLGGLYKLDNDWAFFAQYSQGFKAPPMDAINVGFTNFRGGYTTLPNPDLKAESSDGYELGFKYYGDNAYFEISAYNTQYDDFIESLAFRGVNPDTGLAEFQARNLPSVEIRGLELKGGWDLGSKFNSLEGMSLRYAYALSKGKDKETGNPLNSIDPQQLVAGLKYDSTAGNWGTEFVMTLTEGRDEGDLSGTNDNTFYAPGYGIFDLIGYYDFSDQFSATWGIYNLTDKKFWEANSTIGLELDSTSISRLTQPGRNFAVTLKYEF